MSGHQLQQPAPSRRRFCLAHMVTHGENVTVQDPAGAICILGAARGRACRSDASFPLRTFRSIFCN